MLVTVDLLGIPGRITVQVRSGLAKQTGIRSENVTTCFTYIQSGPHIRNIIFHFDKRLSPEELTEVMLYFSGVPKITAVALLVIRKIQPSQVPWGGASCVLPLIGG